MRPRWRWKGLVVLFGGLLGILFPFLTAPPRAIPCAADSVFQVGSDRFWIEELRWSQNLLRIQWRHRVLPAKDEGPRASGVTLVCCFHDASGTLLTTSSQRHASMAARFPIRPITEEAEIVADPPRDACFVSVYCDRRAWTTRPVPLPVRLIGNFTSWARGE
jgi:hypothetical protein